MSDEKPPTEIGVDLLGVGKVGVQALKSAEPFLMKLFGPYLDERGQMLADGVREKRRQNLMTVAALAAEHVGAREISAVPGRVLFPMLEAAGHEEQPDLQRKWAALMASAATAPDSVPPAFPKILSELSSLEAKMLDASRRLDRRHPRSVNTDDGPKLSELIPAGTTPTQTRIALANLIRLGLLGMDLMPEDVDMFRDDDERFFKQSTRLTGYGAAFIDACTPPNEVIEGEVVVIQNPRP